MNLAELAQRIGGRLQGQADLAITGIASLDEATVADISFVAEARYAAQARETRAAALLVPDGFDQPASASLVFVPNVEVALEQLLELFAPAPDVPPPGVHPAACVAATAHLADSVAVGPHAVIGAHVTIGAGTVVSAGCVVGRSVSIGERCYLGPNVVIAQSCRLGSNVIIHANSSIGTDGFGYRFTEGRHRKIPHIGIVVIEDDVEIGSNACVDRAKFGRTVIGRGTKIDNLVQVAHNVNVGAHCIIVSQTGIAGSARLGNYVVLGGQCGIRDHVKIGDGVMVGATSAVDQDVEPGLKIVGTPAQPVREFFRELSLIKKLPELAKEVKHLRAQLEKSAAPKDHS